MPAELRKNGNRPVHCSDRAVVFFCVCLKGNTRSGWNILLQYKAGLIGHPGIYGE